MKKYLSCAARALACVCLAAATTLPAAAQTADEFVVEDIRISGLQRVSPATVLAYTGFAKGDEIDESILSAAIARLFETGLFRDIEVFRDGAAVIIELRENPTINSIRFDGMEELNEDTVLGLLETQDAAPGRVYQRGINEFITKTIESFYRQSSLFLADVEVVTVPLDDNRIDLVVVVEEGDESRVVQINFNGIEVFPPDDLLDEMELETSGIVATFFDKDVYSQLVFEGDLDRLRSFYFNAGYIRFAVLSTDVRVDADAGGIVIDIFVDEGAQYRFGKYAVSAADARWVGAIEVEPVFNAGDVFNDRMMVESSDKLRDELRELGHAFAQVDTSTDIDDQRLVVDVEFRLEPDNVVNVRNIEFIGNDLSRDDVLRKQLEILEGERYSASKISYSLTRLRRNGYLRNATVTERRVGADEVDLDFNVVEANRGSFLIGAGYSNSDGLSFSLGVKRNNLFGTGNDFSLDLGRSDDDTNINFTFVQPNITDSGISRSFNLFIDNSETSSTTQTGYAISRQGSRLAYNIPLDREWSWDVGFEYERTVIDNYVNLGIPRFSMPFDDFSDEYVRSHGEKQDAWRVSGGIGYDSRDRSFDTTEGGRSRLFIDVATPPSDVEHYQLSFTSEYYQPLAIIEDYTLKVDGGFNYGDAYGDADFYPFYKRYYLRSSQLRGFDTDGLGPQGEDTAIGGRMLVHGSLALERPIDLLDGQSVKIGAFMDAAGLWDSVGHLRDDTEELRTSVGVEVKLRTPVFPLAFSYGVPTRKRKGDKLQPFQFRLGF